MTTKFDGGWLQQELIERLVLRILSNLDRLYIIRSLLAGGYILNPKTRNLAVAGIGVVIVIAGALCYWPQPSTRLQPQPHTFNEAQPRTNAVCTETAYSGASYECPKACRESSNVVIAADSPCQVTSDTGSCEIKARGMMRGACCVCKP